LVEPHLLLVGFPAETLPEFSRLRRRRFAFHPPPGRLCDMNRIATIRLGLMLLVTGCLAANAQTNTPSTEVHVRADEAARLVKAQELTVLDLRTPKEFAAGHIAGATNLNCQAADFAARLEKLDRDKPYLIHCASGRRSTNALPQFEKLGFKRVIHLDGGLKAWQAAEQPVEKP
jgi:rhodanese-related sulfurtransferase